MQLMQTLLWQLSAQLALESVGTLTELETKLGADTAPETNRGS